MFTFVSLASLAIYRIKRPAFMRQTIFVPQRLFVVRMPLDHAIRFELLQTSGQHLRRRFGLNLQFFEARHARVQLPEDQNGPTVADDIE